MSEEEGTRRNDKTDVFTVDFIIRSKLRILKGVTNSISQEFNAQEQTSILHYLRSQGKNFVCYEFGTA